MLTGLLGRKVGMTQIFGPNGMAIPVTVIEAGPCVVTQVKTAASDGYEAIQLGYGEKSEKHATRPEMGHLGHSLPRTQRQRRKQQQEQAKARQQARTARQQAENAATETEADEAEGATSEGATSEGATSEGATASTGKSARRRRGAGKALGPFQALREVGVVGGMPAVGDTVTVGIFSVGEAVDIIGTSKGKGFAGVMKRHGFGGGQRTHGQSDRARAPGSIGPGTTPGRVYKGTRMAGRMGHERVTVQGLEIIQADPERNLLVVQGSVPGANGGLVMIRKGQDQIAVATRAAQQAEKK
jgi:large subunit ribosomal protein L3